MKYFISYSFVTKDNTGFGRCDATRDEKIRSGDDLKSIESAIKEQHGYIGVVILNWQVFEA